MSGTAIPCAEKIRYNVSPISKRLSVSNISTSLFVSLLSIHHGLCEGNEKSNVSLVKGKIPFREKEHANA